GRPGGPKPQLSLAPVANRMSDIYAGSKVRFVEDCVGDKVEKAASELLPGDVLLLENLRFHKEEEANDPMFSKSLASLADVYVNDAFSTSHRKHSSTYGAARQFSSRLAGLNLNKEIEYLSMVKENPAKPFSLVIGGIKIKDKIGALENLLPKADKLLVGGGVAYTFLKAKGINVGNSLVDYDHLSWVTKALSEFDSKIVLPTDHLVASSKSDKFTTRAKTEIPDGMAGFDIGDETAHRFSLEIGGNGSGTIFWNGPMGLFEIGAFSNGTINIAKSMALAFWRGSKTLIGGGDTLEAMKRAGVTETEVSHVSTGGGATLRFLANDEMPGIDALERK
ncbi:MAG TPA: phosphoglycerate kinase, partial [Nitrososphaeraceae archaeon]|nr:phosphoglycerate kinase [Nitrososphaeraceae archaeon]